MTPVSGGDVSCQLCLSVIMRLVTTWVIADQANSGCITAFADQLP